MGDFWQFWPLFGLRIRSERLELGMPTDRPVRAGKTARGGVYAPGEMPFLVPWTETPSPDFEYNFLQYHWGLRSATGIPTRGGWSWACASTDQSAGAQAISADGFAEHSTISTGSWLGRSSRASGYGKEMRAAVLAFSFDYLQRRLGDQLRLRRQPGVDRHIALARLRGDQPRVGGRAEDRVRARPSTS